MIVITNRLPLRTLYPKPPEKCGIVTGNIDRQEYPELSSLLYRVSFKVKADQTGEVYQDLISSNFLFETVNTKGGFRSGSLVTYQPKNKDDPNYGMIAQVKRVTAPPSNIEAVRMGAPRNMDPEKMFFDIEFLAPKEVGGKVIYEKKNLRKSDLKLYHEGDLVYSYECGPDFINYKRPEGSSRVLERYYTARQNFRNSQSQQNRQRLEAVENDLWNGRFVLDKNNQPKYPEISQIEEEFRDELFDYLNKMVERMVSLGFTPNDDTVVKRILGKAPNLKARFPIPKGAIPGKKITIEIGGKQIVVKIPDASLDGSGNYWEKMLKPNEIIEVPIDKDDNSSVYPQLSSSIKNKGDLEFIPTLIKGSFARGKDVKVLDMDKLIPPPKDQQFYIKAAKIKKVDGKNWKFKELDSFDKEMEQIIIDLEVLVDLQLGIKTKYADGEKPGMMGKLGDMIGNALLSSTACPSRMDSLKESLGQVVKKSTPKLSMDERNQQVIDRLTKQEEKEDEMEAERQENIETKRREVRRGGRRKKKTRRKNYKKKRRTLRLNYIKDDYRKSRKRNRKKRTKRRR